MPSRLSSESKRRILIAGMFDMQNYGDLLFPLVAAFRLAPLGIEVVPVAPTARPTGLSDALPAIDIQAMLGEEPKADAIIIGGGYIVHNHQVDLLSEYRQGNLSDWAGPGLWLGATLAGALRDVPVLWNAPGVPHRFPVAQRIAIDAALRAAEYVAVRDQGSAELLAGASDVDVAVVPDPIADLARMWPRATLDAPFRTLLERKGLASGDRYLAIHVRNRSLAETPIADAAAMFSEFARSHGLTPLFIALGRAHEDDVVAQALSRHMDVPHVVLDDATSLREVAAAIAHSSLYLGASLHGYVTAAAYGVPAVLVGRPAYRKFSGFVRHTGRTADLAHDWRDALQLGAGRLSEGRLAGMPAPVLAALDQHWARIAAAIAEPRAKAPEREAFLRAYIRFGMDRLNPGWLFRPLLPRAATREAGPDAASKGMGERLGLPRMPGPSDS